MVEDEKQESEVKYLLGNCAACLEPLAECPWSKKVNLVICLNGACAKFHQPVAVTLRLHKGGFK